MTQDNYNFEEMENWLLARKCKGNFIPPGSNFTLQEIERLIQLYELNKSDFKMIFANNPLTEKYTIENECSECHETVYLQISKTNLINRIKQYKTQSKCKTCEEAATEKLRQEREFSIERTENTIEFIELYLNPDCHWSKDVKMSHRVNILHASIYGTHQDEISGYIQNMPYRDFLKTPYWKAIAHEARRRADFRCQLCNDKGVLDVHHRSYEMKGYELHYRAKKDLIVLCRGCHSKHHDIDESEEEVI